MKKISLTGSQLAGELGLSQPRVTQLTSAGVLKRSASGYNLKEAVQAYVQYRLSSIGGSEETKLLESRLRKLAADLDREKLLLKKARAELLPTEEAARVYNETRRRAFTAMEKLSDLAPELEEAGDDRMLVFELVDTRAREILIDLSNQPILASVEE